MTLTKKKRLGEILCEEGFLNTSQLEEALEKQKRCCLYVGHPLGHILVALDYITLEQLSKALLIQEELRA
jgi:hypothetical protein